MWMNKIGKFVSGGCVALTLSIGMSAAASAAITSLTANSGGWVSNYDATSLDPTANYGSMPPIDTSGANFEAANPAWRTLGYNDSAWSAYSGGWAPSDGTHSPMYLRKVFTIGAATSGNFTIIVDDDFQVWVNNIMVFNDNSQGCCTQANIDLLPFLVTGDNIIAVKADNSPGGGYFIEIGGSINAADFGATVPEPGSLALLGLGLMGAVVARRRKSK
jgi:PEP-CTERM motif